MSDLARLGFAVDTKDVTVAEQKLDRLVPAAKRAENAAKGFGTALIGLGGGAKATKSGVDLLTESVKRSAAAKAVLKTGLMSSSAGTAEFTRIMQSAIPVTNALDASIENMNASFGQTSGFVNRVKHALDGLVPEINAVKTANDNLALSQRNLGATAGQLQANTANLAAQFQDIGVTAAMGMNPMMIGMQQGAQIALVMQQAVGAQGLAGGLAQLGKSFLSVLGPVTFLSIAFTALLAYGFQIVDWTGLAKDGLNLLADNLVTLTKVAMVAGATLAIAFAPQIIAGVTGLAVAIGTTLVTAIRSATLAMLTFSLTNPFAAMVIAIAAVGAALYLLRDEVTQVLGFDLFKVAKDAGNNLIAAMVGAYNTVKQTWHMLPASMGDITVRAVNRMLKAMADGLNYLTKMYNDSFLGKMFGASGGFVTVQFANPWEGAEASLNATANAAKAAAQSVDYLGNAWNGAVSLAEKGASKLRTFADSLGATKPEDDKKGGDKGSDKAAKVERDPWDDILKNAEARITALKAEGEQIHLVGEALARAKYETELLAAAKSADITLTDGQRTAIGALASEMARLDVANQKATFMKSYNDDLEEQLLLLGQERTEMSLIGDELKRYRLEMKILNDARRAGIDLSDEEVRAMADVGMGYEQARAELEAYKNQIEAQREVFKSFYNDMRDGLMQGQSAWKAFGSAILNVLSRVGDKLVELWLDQAFQALMNGGQGGGGGLLGTLISAAGSILGGTPGGPGTGIASASSITGGFKGIKFAKGGAFGPGGIFDVPTTFGFGGGQSGMMGEAGPEAVMPLARGPDGSLGVQVNGAARQQAQLQRIELRVSAVEGSMFRPTVEAIADERAVTVVEAGLQQYDNHLPDRMQMISNDPRTRAA